MDCEKQQEDLAQLAMLKPLKPRNLPFWPPGGSHRRHGGSDGDHQQAEGSDSVGHDPLEPSRFRESQQRKHLKKINGGRL